jgi:hypothetical protein
LLVTQESKRGELNQTWRQRINCRLGALAFGGIHQSVGRTWLGVVLENQHHDKTQHQKADKEIHHTFFTIKFKVHKYLSLLQKNPGKASSLAVSRPILFRLNLPSGRFDPPESIVWRFYKNAS